MDIGFILIASILVLGGAIATVGDRLGTRVGKARLSLFNLRPRQTAVLVTILTGTTISASTLAILFATSKPLRTGLFQLDEIQRKLRTARGDLEETIAQKQQTEVQKNQIESELTKTLAQKNRIENEFAKTLAQKKQTESELVKTKSEKDEAQKRLDATNQSLQDALAKQFQTAQQASTLRTEIKSRLAERQELIQQRNQVKAEITQLKAENERQKAENEQQRAENNQLKGQNSLLKEKVTERDREIARQDEVIAQGETRLKEREKQLKQAIAQRETRLDDLEKQLKDREKQLTFLQQELATLEEYYQYYQVLRQGNLALLRGQVLASGVVRIVDPAAARQAVDQLLSEAHRTAIKATRPANSDADEIVVQITPAQVQQLIDQIKDGRDYVVRILSAGNYVVGEKHVQAFADVALNQVVFSAGDVVATTSADPSKMSEEEIRQRLEQLLAASQFRARRAGIVGDRIQIGDGRITTLIGFIEQLKQYNKPVDLKAVVEEDTYTAGPLKMHLVAVGDGKVISST